MTDPAVQWFLDDAKAQGLSVREYERRFGIILLPAEHEIAAHEVPMSASPEYEAGRFRAIQSSDDISSAGRNVTTRRPLAESPPYETRVVVAPGAQPVAPPARRRRPRSYVRRQSAIVIPLRRRTRAA